MNATTTRTAADLTLSVQAKGETYAVTFTDETLETATILKSGAANPYLVKTPKAAGAKFYCNCPSWRFQKVTPSERHCKHTTAVRLAADILETRFARV